MENILLVVHILIALAIIALILLQQGKGAEMGASFGSGSSQTVFGASGGGNFFSSATAVLVAVFFITSFTLALSAKSEAPQEAGMEGLIPSAEQVDIPAASSDIPAASIPSGDVPSANVPNVDVPSADAVMDKAEAGAQLTEKALKETSDAAKAKMDEAKENLESNIPSK